MVGTVEEVRSAITAKWTAIIVSALLFALIHGNIDQLVYPFLLGLIFAVIADRTSSTVPTIFAHFVNNCTVIVINYLSTINHASQNVTVDLKFVLLSILFAVLAGATIVGLLFCTKREVKVSKGDNQTANDDSTVTAINQNDLAYFEKVQTKPNTYLWIGIAIGCIIWILNLII